MVSGMGRQVYDRSRSAPADEEIVVTRTIEVLHVGSASRDLTSDDPRGWRLGGGVTYAALATARLGLRTAAVIGADHGAAGAHELETLRAAGVDTLLVPLGEGPIFHNVETPSGRQQTILQVGQPLEPVPLPASWLRAPGWSFVPVADEVPDRWAEVPVRDAVVGVGWQGMLRHLVAGERVRRLAPGPRALLRRADLVGVSRHDVDPETPLAELTRLLRPGARLLVTHGEDGGLLIHIGATGPDSTLRYAPTRADIEVDPTGAGDTFLAALLAAVVHPGVLAPSRRVGADLRFAAAAGSLAVEAVGLAGVPDRGQVVIRRARERVRRVLTPALTAQVGSLGEPED